MHAGAVQRRAAIAAVALAVLATCLLVPLNYAASVHGLAWQPSLLEYSVALVGTYAVLGLLASACWRFVDSQSPFTSPTRRELVDAGLGLLATLLVVVVLAALVRGFGLPVAEPNVLAPVLEGLAGWPAGPERVLVALPLFVLLVVPIEEFLFRGLIQTILTRAFSARGSIVAASALFALFTVPVFAGGGLLATLLPVGVAFVLSIIWGDLYHRTGTLLAPAMAHASLYVVVMGSMYLLATLARG